MVLMRMDGMEFQFESEKDLELPREGDFSLS
jgi:hypothetical protein